VENIVSFIRNLLSRRTSYLSRCCLINAVLDLGSHALTVPSTTSPPPDHSASVKYPRETPSYAGCASEPDFAARCPPVPLLSFAGHACDGSVRQDVVRLAYRYARVRRRKDNTIRTFTYRGGIAAVPGDLGWPQMLYWAASKLPETTRRVRRASSVSQKLTRHRHLSSLWNDWHRWMLLYPPAYPSGSSRARRGSRGYAIRRTLACRSLR